MYPPNFDRLTSREERSDGGQENPGSRSSPCDGFPRGLGRGHYEDSLVCSDN